MGRMPHVRMMTTFTIVGLVLFVHPPSVLAIECDPPGPPAEEFPTYDAVFVGTPTAVFCMPHRVSNFVYKHARFLHGGYLDSTYCSVFFSVDQSWKGVVTTNTHVRAYSWPYGPDFEIGQQYLVYASKGSKGSDNIWHTPPQYCSRTTTISKAAEDFNYLGTFPILQLKSTFSPLTWVAIGIAVAVFLLVAFMLILKSRHVDSENQRLSQYKVR